MSMNEQLTDKVATENYWLDFDVPDGLMPDKQFDGLKARLRVHRIKPVYENGRSPSEPPPAVVLIHGRTVPGPVAFDLREPGSGDGDSSYLSVQEALARAGIDTFAPSLLGYGLSTRFDKGLDDPGNASLRPYPPESPTSCPYPEGCDRTLIPGINPLGDEVLRTRGRERPLGWPPFHAQGSTDRVDQVPEIQRRGERFFRRQREWRGESRVGDSRVLRSSAVAVPDEEAQALAEITACRRQVVRMLTAERNRLGAATTKPVRKRLQAHVR
jgi:hypothetical protein